MRESKDTINLNSVRISCQKCSLSELCLPRGLDESELESLDKMIKPSRLLKRGEKLYQANQPFRSLFAVRSGCFRTYLTTEDGEEQVTGFHLPGELFGLDGIDSGLYSCSAQSLEISSVCELPFENFDELCEKIPGFRRQFIRFIGNQVTSDQKMLLVLGKMSAESRLANFLLSLSNRFKVRGYSDKEFNLTMPRHDLANYLGLAVETLSRIFKRFQEKRILEVKGRHINILDASGLEKLAVSCNEKCKAVATK